MELDGKDITPQFQKNTVHNMVLASRFASKGHDLKSVQRARYSKSHIGVVAMLIILLTSMMASAQAHLAVRIWEEPLVIPTYKVGAPELNPIFYHQHVIKPAHIGMLGSWISGGVEWNIPHHHRASTFMTVDHALTENSDGSKTIWVGEIELRHRMKWLTGLTLYPARSFIEVSAKLFNRTPLAHCILYFANAAVHANESYLVIFPPSTEFATYHGKNQFTRWPIGDGLYGGMDYTGVDLSWWRNHPAPISFFAWNYKEDFLAGYDHKKQAGVVLVADHHVIPGKKFFEWGNGSQGETWDKILTDNDGPYLELMVGGYSDNQPDYSWCRPYEVKSLKQYWYPIRQIGGVKNANQDAAVNLQVTPERVVLTGIITTAQCTNAKVLLHAGEKLIFDETTDIGPANPFRKEIALPAGSKEEDLRLSLLSPDNKELVSYKPVRNERSPMPEPVKPPPPPQEIKTIEELYLTGLRLEQFYNATIEPYPHYEEALKRDPGDYRVNTALGILYLKRGMFKEAEDKLNRAIQRATRNYTSPKDGEAFYSLGVALKAQGKNAAAYDAFYKALWNQAWSAAGYYSLAELECQKGDFLKALEFLDALNTKMRGAVQSYLELAVDYGNCGLWDEAIEVLSRLVQPGKQPGTTLPMVYYYLGYLLEKKGEREKALQSYNAPSAMLADYCFPFRLESIDVLRGASRMNPGDERAPYYLGNLLYDLLENNQQTVLKYDDALAREIMLHVQLGHYDRAIDLLKGHDFHVWEGGGMIHDV